MSLVDLAHVVGSTPIEHIIAWSGGIILASTIILGLALYMDKFLTWFLHPR